MKFKSKVDLWLDLIFIAILLANLWLFYEMILTFRIGLLVTFVIATSVDVLLILPIRFNTYYELTDNSFTTHCGFYKNKINNFDIISVQKSHSPINAAALSLDRLEIVYRCNGHENIILISPKNKDAFLSELHYKNVLIKML